MFGNSGLTRPKVGNCDETLATYSTWGIDERWLKNVTPLTGLGRLLGVLEAGTGTGFLALIIGYVPVIYQAFSRREAGISLLDARAWVAAKRTVGDWQTSAWDHIAEWSPEKLEEITHIIVDR